MVHGDETMATAPVWAYQDILKSRAPLLAMVASAKMKSGTAHSSGTAAQLLPVPTEPAQLALKSTSGGPANSACAGKGLEGAFATTGGKRKDPSAETTGQHRAPSQYTWECTACTYTNVEVLSGFGKKCDVCQTARPGAKRGSVAVLEKGAGAGLKGLGRFGFGPK
jgi:hypothetical protein